MCNLDCFHCPYEDCINDGELNNQVKCRNWYQRNREKKIAYQKAYNKAHRAEIKAKKLQKAKEPIDVPKVTKLLKFSELDVLIRRGVV